MSDLQQMNVADAKAWYDRFYTPNNATLVVIGDVDSKNVYALAKAHFGTLKAHPLIERKAQSEPPRLGKKLVEVHAHAELPMLMLGFTVPTVKTVSATDILEPYALEIIAGILDAGDSGRFSKELIRTTQVASNMDIFYNLYARYQTQFVLYGTPNQSHPIADLKQAILTELKRLQNEPLNEDELQRVKTQIIAQKTFERDSIFGQAMELGMLETVGIGWQTAEKYVDRINRVTAKDIQAVAQRYFQEKNMTEAQLIPVKTERTQ